MAEPEMAESNMADPEIPVSIDDALLDRLSASGISFLVSSTLFDKEGLTKCHAQAAAAFKRMVDDPECLERKFSHYVLDPVWPSAPFAALEDMVLDDLICPDTQKDPDMLPVTVHHGRMVHGTLCAKPFVTGGVRTVFEDTQGRAVLLVIDNALCTTASEADVCKKYPEGMKVAIKEPAFTHLWKDGTLGINVANPADVVPTASTSLADKANTYLHQGRDGRRLGLDCIKELHALANAHLADNECTRALHCYSSCGILLEDFKDIIKAAEDVESSIPDTGEASTSTSGSADDRVPDLLRQEIQEMLRVINSERCETYLRLGSYKKALADADMWLQLNPNCAKSTMQRAKCLHGMHLYSEEAACLEELQASLGTSEPELDLLAEILHQKFRASIAMKQSLGIYELDDHEFSRLSVSELVPRCAPFVGSIELRTGRESGTAGGQEPGMFASQDVKPGELLLVTNPFALGKAHWTRPRIRFYCRRPPRTREEADHGHLTSWSARFQNTFVETIAKAQQSPQYAAQLRSMLRSSRTRKPSLDLFTVDWDEVEFGDVSSMEKHQRHLVNVDIRDIRYVLATNGIVDGALYGLPSFFRHSCAPNCIRYTESTQSGGAMFISSTCSIPAGEELSILSVSIFHSNLLRSEEFTRHFLQDFCTCPRCTSEDKALLDIPDLGDLLFRYNEEIETLGAYASTQKVENMLSACSEVKDGLERVLHGDESAHLSGKEKDWIRCSFALAFVFPVLSCPGSVAAGSLDEIVRVLTSVEPGTSSALTILALCMHKMQFSDIERILQEKYVNQDLYFPFKTTNSDNLLNWGRIHFPRLLPNLYLEVD